MGPVLDFLAAVVAASPPIVFAVLGETITERAGVTNLSLNGTLMLTAMAGFAVAMRTGNLVAGFATAMAIGAFVALLIAFGSLTLRLPQVAVGFVLTLLCRDLAYVLGQPYTGRPGPQVPHRPIPGLVDIPVLGQVLFDHNVVVYLSVLAIALTWVYFFRTRPGLSLLGLGEGPVAAFVRGIDVVRARYLYTVLGGAIVGFGGASFSLLVDPGWSRPKGIDGTGWIALAIVIFGNWQPIRGALGAYFFVVLQQLAIKLQSALPNVPTQVFSTLPFPLMILTLLLVTIGNAEWVNRVLGVLPEGARRFFLRTIRALQTTPPAGLGTTVERE
ncbi:MAG: ABC transporter permease [Chloroflexia bacterium]